MRVRRASAAELRSAKPVPAAPVVEEKSKKKFSTTLAHPSYVIEPCPNCEFPEADGGYCPDCGWTEYQERCPHCN